MLVIVLIFIVGLAPACISAFMTVRADRRAQNGLNAAVEASGHSPLKALLDSDKELQYVEGLGYMIGDITCELNARSPYLRCAVNPMGPCDGCRAYAPKVFERQF